MSDDDGDNNKKMIIGLFGATGNTGSAFLKYAIENGHTIRALVRTPSKVPTEDDNTLLTIIQGSIEQEDKVKECIKGCTHVVVMVGKSIPVLKEEGYENKTLLLDFMKVLYPSMIMESKNKSSSSSSSRMTLLYQGGALMKSPNQESLFWFEWTLRKVISWFVPAMECYSHDHEQVSNYIEKEQQKQKQKQKEKKDKETTTGGDDTTTTSTCVNVIVTRPAGLKQRGDDDENNTATELKVIDSPPRLVSSMITYQDLAEFSLKALTKEELYGTYPYVGW